MDNSEKIAAGINYWFQIPFKEMDFYDLNMINCGIITLTTRKIFHLIELMKMFNGELSLGSSGTFVDIRDYCSGRFPFDPFAHKNSGSKNIFGNFKTIGPDSGIKNKDGPDIIDCTFDLNSNLVSVCLSNYEVMVFDLQKRQTRGFKYEFVLVSTLSDEFKTHFNKLKTDISGENMDLISNLCVAWSPGKNNGFKILAVAGKSQWIYFFSSDENGKFNMAHSQDLNKMSCMVDQNRLNWIVKLCWCDSDIMCVGLSNGDVCMFTVGIKIGERKGEKKLDFKMIFIKRFESDSELDLVRDIKFSDKNKIIYVMRRSETLAIKINRKMESKIDFIELNRISIKNPNSILIINEAKRRSEWDVQVSSSEEIKLFSQNLSEINNNLPVFKNLNNAISASDSILKQLIGTTESIKKQFPLVKGSILCPCGLTLYCLLPAESNLQESTTKGSIFYRGYLVPTKFSAKETMESFECFQSNCEEINDFEWFDAFLRSVCISNAITFAVDRSISAKTKNGPFLNFQNGNVPFQNLKNVSDDLISFAEGVLVKERMNMRKIKACFCVLNAFLKVILGRKNSVSFGIIEAVKNVGKKVREFLCEDYVWGNREKIEQKKKGKESCLVCKAELYGFNLLDQKCTAGHLLDRCVLTFELIEPENVSASCNQCGSKVSKNFVNIDQTGVICPICGAKMSAD